MMDSNRRVVRTVRLSVLDRLQQGDSSGASDPETSWEESVKALKNAVLRDLDWLLNTRRIAEPAPDGYPETQRSVYHFGLPDITSLPWGSEVVHRRLLRQIEECIQRFEPRLTSVRVSPVEEKDGGHRHVRFMVEGLLRVEPNPERVAFDTVLEIASGTFRVAGAANA
jgi:type VI secretion system protein ImpF